MKILFFDWWTYTFDDVAAGFKNLGIEYDLVQYRFEDKNHDEKFKNDFLKLLNKTAYDAVYSTNYFPIIAECCYEKNIVYISWSYDNPLNVVDIEETLAFPTNRVFLFDKIQVSGFINKGYENIFHMPLAANVNRLSKIKLNSEEVIKYSADVGFVGKLYPALVQEYMQGMTEYQKGYLEGICSSQQQLYGYYIVDELLTEDFIQSVNDQYYLLRGDREVQFTKESLSYAVGCQVTRNDRMLLLALLSNHFDVKLYCRENNPFLNKVTYMGPVDYATEMPKVFMGSKVNLNINLKVSQSGIPLRVMDVCGCGGFLLSSYQPEIAEYFEDGKEVVLYESIEDAYEKAQYYILHNESRELIANAGRAKVAELFTYEKQLSKIFNLSIGK